MIFRLEPPIPVYTPMGEARAIAWIDRGDDSELQWVCFINETRQCWTFRNPFVRDVENLTMGRPRLEMAELYRGQEEKIKIFDFMKEREVRRNGHERE